MCVRLWICLLSNAALLKAHAHCILVTFSSGFFVSLPRSCTYETTTSTLFMNVLRWRHTHMQDIKITLFHISGIVLKILNIFFTIIHKKMSRKKRAARECFMKVHQGIHFLVGWVRVCAIHL